MRYLGPVLRLNADVLEGDLVDVEEDARGLTAARGHVKVDIAQLRNNGHGNTILLLNEKGE